MKRLLVLVFCLAQFCWAQSAPPAQGQLNPSKQLTLEAMFAEGGITGRAPETIRWSPDGSRVSFIQRDNSGDHGALYTVDVATGAKSVLVTEDKLASLSPPPSSVPNERERERLARYGVAGYQWAPDSKHLLFDSRHQLWYYTLETGTAVQLTAGSEPSSDPKFSPQGDRVAYIYKHNLYVRSVQGGHPTALTKDTDENLLNGEVDWVYAEELRVRSNYFWSPDGKQIAFLQMNEKPVPAYPITDWMPQHPTVDQQKYPKAGDPNPGVRVGVVGAGGGSIKWITVGDAPDREYVPRFGWVRDGLVWIQILNRAQNKLELYFVDTGPGRAQRMLTESSDAWVPVNDNFHVLKSGDRFVWSSWNSGYTHLYLFSFNKSQPFTAPARPERPLTKGEFDVDSVLAVDEDSNTIYVTANAGDWRQQQIFAVQLDGSEMRRISLEAGTHQPTFAPGAKYYADNYSALMTPPRLALCKAGGACQPFWEARSLAAYDLLRPQWLELKAADGATPLQGTLLMPPNAGGKHPVILNPYGGPAIQSARDMWRASMLFDQILARRGFAVLKVDNRGMAGRGKAFAKAVMKKLGEVELADQLAALDQVLAANPQLDGSRIGWWGSSYGGFMTLYGMTHSERVRAGVAVAPVADWRDYDSIYTERYMGLPQENPDGYRNSAPVNFAANLKGRLLEVHGTSDDNVHLQNTMQMINSLINAGVQFDLQLYPRKTHGITGRAARTHVYRRVLQHFETYLLNVDSGTK